MNSYVQPLQAIRALIGSGCIQYAI
jgi:hypothetical protein